MPRKPDHPHVTDSGHDIPSGIPRVIYAQECRMQGMRYMQTVNAIVKKFGITDRQAKADIKEAHKRIAEANEQDLPLDIAKVKEELWNTVDKLDAAARMSIEGFGDGPDDEFKPDIKAHVSAISARTQPLARLASILGMDAPTKVQVEGGITEEQRRLLDALSMTPAQRAKRAREIERELTGESAAGDGE